MKQKVKSKRMCQIFADKINEIDYKLGKLGHIVLMSVSFITSMVIMQTFIFKIFPLLVQWVFGTVLVFTLYFWMYGLFEKRFKDRKSKRV